MNATFLRTGLRVDFFTLVIHDFRKRRGRLQTRWEPW